MLQTRIVSLIVIFAVAATIWSLTRDDGDGDVVPGAAPYPTGMTAREAVATWAVKEKLQALWSLCHETWVLALQLERTGGNRFTGLQAYLQSECTGIGARYGREAPFFAIPSSPLVCPTPLAAPVYFIYAPFTATFINREVRAYRDAAGC